MNKIYLNQIIYKELAGFRLDQALAKLFPQYSRSQMQQWIEGGAVSINQKTILKNKEKVHPGQLVEVKAILEDKEDWQPESIPLEIIYQDEQLLVINKPPGLVVHPGAGNPKSTLVNALLYFDQHLIKIPRAGLIHRLDKDTTGLLLVARTLKAQRLLSEQMQNRQVARVYHAITWGICSPSGSINLPIGRHPTQRTKMAVVPMGKAAITHYQLLQKFKAHSYLEVKLETGRTHQIRVHLADIGHPILGDPLYGKRIKSTYLSPALCELIEKFPRQALHAKSIAFVHPTQKESLFFECPLPEDFLSLLNALKQEAP